VLVRYVPLFDDWFSAGVNTSPLVEACREVFVSGSAALILLSIAAYFSHVKGYARAIKPLQFAAIILAVVVAIAVGIYSVARALGREVSPNSLVAREQVSPLHLYLSDFVDSLGKSTCIPCCSTSFAIKISPQHFAPGETVLISELRGIRVRLINGGKVRDASNLKSQLGSVYTVRPVFTPGRTKEFSIRDIGLTWVVHRVEVWFPIDSFSCCQIAELRKGEPSKIVRSIIETIPIEVELLVEHSTSTETRSLLDTTLIFRTKLSIDNGEGDSK
jgi:hypothetical protein